MLIPRAAVAATFAAFTVGVLGAPPAVAVESRIPLHGPSAEPSATPDTSDPAPATGEPTAADAEQVATSAHDHEGATGDSHHDMTGMGEESMPGMSHDDMPGMSHDDMPGMSHEPAAGDSHAPADGSHEDAAHDSGSSEATDEDVAGHAHAGGEISSEPRPVAGLVGGFVALNSAVLFSAAMLRRRDRRLASTSTRRSRTAQ